MQAMIDRVVATMRRGALYLVVVATAACGSSSADPFEDAIALPGGSTLLFEGMALTSEQRPQIEQVVRDAVVEARRVISLDRITIIVRHGTVGGVVPQLGFGGRADNGTVVMTIDVDSPAWPESLGTEFFRVLAHELHHVARFRAVGFNNNLLKAMVTEGLADQFMVQLSGGDPPIWATALVGEELESWLVHAQDEWLERTFDRAAWFNVGVPSPIPEWAGYAVGFELTRRFLAANPSQRASTLVGEPATSFIPVN